MIDMHKVIYFFLILIVSSSCREKILENSPGDFSDTSHYIYSYENEIGSIHLLESDSSIQFELKGKTVSNNYLQSKEYKEISTRYGDDSFSGRISESMQIPILANDTISFIHLICEENFDVDHLKGSYVDDLVQIHYISCKEVLSSSYQDLNVEKQYNLGIFNEMSEKYLIANIINLVFTSAPNEAGSYKFNLQCMNTRGKMWQKTVSFEFKR